VFESEVAFHVRFHCRIRSGRTRDSECSRDITELRRN
jgi:hypothetical protein